MFGVEQAVVGDAALCCGRQVDGFDDLLNAELVFVKAFRTHRPGCGTMYCWLVEV
jgi:hypothetical protein